MDMYIKLFHRVYKRPGLEEFLQELSNKFEIVLYTD